MIKRILQNIAPDFILKYYKQFRYVSIIKNAELTDEPDLIIAQKIVTLDSTVIDIGANIGIYSHFLSPHAKKIISFEPVPFTFKMLENNARTFGWDNVEAHQVALSDQEGEIFMNVPIDSGVYNYFRASVSRDKNESKMASKVITQTIDSLFYDYSEPISFVKCDTEGHELAVLEGAQKFLEGKKPAWLIEVTGDPDDHVSDASKCFQLLKSHGYEAYLYNGNELIKRITHDSSVNYFFLQESHVKRLKNKGVNVKVTYNSTLVT